MSVETLPGMIVALDCSRKFYEEAAERVDRDDLKLLFQDLARFKKAMLEDLRDVAVGHHEYTSKDGLAEQLKNTYAKVKSTWDADEEHRYLASLAISEDQILHAFGSAMVNSDDIVLRDIARKHLESLIQCHHRLLKIRYDQPV